MLFVLDFQPKGLARLMDGMIAKTMQSEVGNLAKQAIQKYEDWARRLIQQGQ